MFSPEFLNLYGENTLRELGDNAWIVVGGYNKNNFRYADDTTLVTDSEENLQHILNTIDNGSKMKGKQNAWSLVRKKTTPTCKIYIHGKRIRQAGSFNYLESTVTSNGKCDEGIKQRIALEKASFPKMNILKSGKLSMEAKLMAFLFLASMCSPSKHMAESVGPSQEPCKRGSRQVRCGSIDQWCIFHGWSTSPMKKYCGR